MNVKDVMNRSVITCRPDDTVGYVSILLRDNHISGVPVVENGKVVGIVSETDLIKLYKATEFPVGGLWLPSPLEVIELPIRNLARYEEIKRALEKMRITPVREIMKKTVYSISPEDSLEEASRRMVEHRVNRLPVVENGKLVGIVARCDIIKGLSTAKPSATE